MDQLSRPRIGVVGCGNWGRHLVRNFHEMGLLACVCDKKAENLQLMLKTHGCASMGVDEMFASDQIDAVVIATPAQEHYRMAVQAIEAGKHVFVEKPLAVTASQAHALMTAARRADRVLMVGHVLRYHPCFRELQRIVQSGAIGGLRYVRTVRATNHRFKRQENAVWGFAPHDISMILALAGETPGDVYAHGDHVAGGKGADVALASLNFPSGLMGHLFVSWCNHVKEQKLIVSGETGAIVFDDCEDWDRKLVLHRSDAGDGSSGGGEQGECIVVDKAEPLRAECDHFVRCIVDGTRPTTDGVEGTSVVRVLESMIRSMESGVPVNFES